MARKGLADDVDTHIGAQHLRDGDRPVGVLVVLQNGGHGAANGHTGSIEGMHQLGFVGLVPLEADGGAAGLVVLEVCLLYTSPSPRDS